jgi:hypothetical protein
MILIMSKTKIIVAITLSTTHKNPKKYASAIHIGDGR